MESICSNEARAAQENRGRSRHSGCATRATGNYGGGVMSLIEITGPIGAPVVVVLGGISSSRHVTATAANPAAGWWNEFVGPAKPIDTLEFRVVSMDYLGGIGDEALSTHHQASALLDTLD